VIKTTIRLAKIAWIVAQATRTEARHPGGRNCNDR
jgi:hypothetical protein